MLICPLVVVDLHDSMNNLHIEWTADEWVPGLLLTWGILVLTWRSWMAGLAAWTIVSPFAAAQQGGISAWIPESAVDDFALLWASGLVCLGPAFALGLLLNRCFPFRSPIRSPQWDSRDASGLRAGPWRGLLIALGAGAMAGTIFAMSETLPAIPLLNWSEIGMGTLWLILLAGAGIGASAPRRWWIAPSLVATSASVAFLLQSLEDGPEVLQPWVRRVYFGWYGGSSVEFGAGTVVPMLALAAAAGAWAGIGIALVAYQNRRRHAGDDGSW